MRSLLLCLLFSGALLAQQTEAGAKVFISPQPITSEATTTTRPLFYVTRISPSGGEERIAAPYVFPPRSKAILNVLPLKDGHLVVFVGESEKLISQQLYPWARNKTGDGDLVRAGENIRIPIQFDDKPGDTKFTVALIEEDSRSGEILSAVHAKKSSEAVKALDSYLFPKGKGIVMNPQDTVTHILPPVTYSTLSLRNQ